MQGEYVNHFRFFLCLFSYIFNDAGDETIEKEKMKEQQKKREIETCCKGKGKLVVQFTIILKEMETMELEKKIYVHISVWLNRYNTGVP